MIKRKAYARSSSLAATAILSSLFSLIAVGEAHAAPPSPSGVWLWDDGRAAVEFHRCNDAFCGRIVWLKRSVASNTGPALDEKNPDPALRRRSICGLDYITGVRVTKSGDWKNGRIYDFNGGASFDLDIDSIGPNQIRMRGYKGIRMLGVNLTLIRPTTDLTLCKAAVQNP